MTMKFNKQGALVAITSLTLATLIPSTPSWAASHREAPLMALDPAADITDVYAFVSYDQANLNRKPEDRKVTFIMNAIPGQEPGSGPNYFAFDDNVRYQFIVDNDRSGGGLDDIVYEVRFKTEVTGPRQFVRPVAGVGPLPPITALEGAGAAGLASIQRYTVTELRNCSLTTTKALRDCNRTELFGGAFKPTVPSNIGPRTIPDYEGLAEQGIFTEWDTGIRVFAGQRAETFAIDLGAVFDTINLRVETPPAVPGRPPLPVQTAAEDANDAVNTFGVNNFSGFNINTIAIEVPIRRLTSNGQPANADNGTIGMWARTLRHEVTLRAGEPRLDVNKPPKKFIEGKGPFVQVSRMANPLVNELIIRFGRKDLWNATLPEDEAIFLDAYRKLDVAGALQLVSGVPVTPNPREDIVGLLLKYKGQNPDPKVGPFSELLRLDMTVPPTPPAQIKRLGPFAHDATGAATPDPAGFPNGRRPDDDVTDIVVRAAGGTNYVKNFVGDGVGINEKGITADFPFLPTPFDGRNRRHIDPGE
ncbi:DUF4331 domain-containing protein [Methyloglobulus sp.]|uniref:DUF4331 domain-containing protein n=1 Tax=Methyloglobulus sp. TaxID=2518622 RepID=UPI00398A4C8B